MRTGKWLMFITAFFLLYGLSSCKEWDKWDDPSANQKITNEVVVDPAYSNVSEPTMGKEGSTYYIISSNATIDGITARSGLMVRTTSDLVNMTMSDTTAYILSDIVESKKEELLALNSSVDTSSVTIREPFLLDTGSGYLLYYSVSDGGNTSLIGVASASSLSGFSWTDQGTILTSTSSGGYVAACPSALKNSDGYYMVFGNAGIYVVKLTSDGTAVNGTPSNIISTATASSPSMVYYNGYYHLFFTVYGMSVYEGASASPTGSFTDYTGYASTDLNFRVLTPYTINGGTTWTATTGVNVWQDPDNSNWYVVHEASGSLHVRSMHWIDPANVTSNFANGCTHAIPAINPQRYTTVESTSFSTKDFVGTWYYGTLWEISSSGSNAVSSTTMVFSADGTYTDGSSGGTWSFDEATKILTLHSNSWSEYLSLYVSYASDWDNDKAPVLTASGTDMYSWYGGSWMQHPLTTTITYTRTGIYGPTMGYDGSNYYMITGNAAISGYESSWKRGLPLFSSDELVLDFFDFKGYILDDVIDNWAQDRLLALDASTDTSSIIMDHPCLRQMSDGTWRLYYSVSSGGHASVIGYATASSPGGTWADQGEILSSDANTLYKASAPSFCTTSDGDYLAFGEYYGGIYGVQLNSGGAVSGSPVLLSYCSADANTAQRVGYPVLFYSGGYYHLYVSYNDQSVCQSASTSALGTYYDFSNYELSGTTGGFADCRLLTGYDFSDASYIYTNPNNGIDVFTVNSQMFIIHQISLNGDDPVANVRKLGFIDVSSMTISNLHTGTTAIVPAPFPAVCPEPYTGDEYTDDITTETICAYEWDYGTLWYLYTSGAYNYIGNPVIVFSSDGTYVHSGTTSGGTWDYNSSTKVLHLYSTAWSGENIYLYVQWAADSENSGVGQTLVASGINSVYRLHPGVWMKQQR